MRSNIGIRMPQLAESGHDYDLRECYCIALAHWRQSNPTPPVVGVGITEFAGTNRPSIGTQPEPRSIVIPRIAYPAGPPDQRRDHDEYGIGRLAADGALKAA